MLQVLTFDQIDKQARAPLGISLHVPDASNNKRTRTRKKAVQSEDESEDEQMDKDDDRSGTDEECSDKEADGHSEDGRGFDEPPARKLPPPKKAKVAGLPPPPPPPRQGFARVNRFKLVGQQFLQVRKAKSL